MHVLAVNSVSTLLNYFLEQLKETPTLEQIKRLQEDAKVGNDGKEEGILNSLFKTELLLEPQAWFFSPNLQDFQSGISEVIASFQDTVLSVENLVPDSYFDAFTR